MASVNAMDVPAPAITPAAPAPAPAAAAPSIPPSAVEVPASATASIIESSAAYVFPYRIPPPLPFPDIGHLAKWSVSSYKFGFGPECLRDDDPDTFWHSDGPQPHYITLEFPRKVAIQKLSIHLSFTMDDSYTPATLAVRAGTSLMDLQDIRIVTLEKPDGWYTFDVSAEPNEDGDGLKPVNAYILQIIVVANHMNGKDTHVRGLKVLGPLGRRPTYADTDEFPFSTPKFRMYERIR